MSRLSLMLGGGAIAAYFWSRSKRTSGKASSSAPLIGPLPGHWVWPVPSWKGRSPVISDGFGSPRPGGIRHGGVDVMFKRLPIDSFRSGSVNASALHVMPDNVVAVAASDGVIWSAMQTPRGFAVVIDHSPSAPYSTFYTHLDKLLVAPTANAASKQRVRAGQPIGIIGFDPLDAAKLKHLHFELWRGNHPTGAVDPANVLRTWEVVSDPRETLLARNASFVYRRIGASGEPYPQWVRDLKGESGVYVIRELDNDGNAEIVYVGSSTGRLYDTVTRHFQTWRRYKGFWRGQYGEGHDPGLTYRRDRVDVAVRLTRPSDALDEEARLIVRLRPRDNLIGQPIEEEVPF